MVTVDSTGAFVWSKRKPDRLRGRKREQIQQMSQKLVDSGEIPLTPCLICGSQEALRMQHIEPMRPDRFVFLCKPCHYRANYPLYRVVSFTRYRGQFSVRPEAVVPRKEVCCG